MDKNWWGKDKVDRVSPYKDGPRYIGGGCDWAGPIGTPIPVESKVVNTESKKGGGNHNEN